MPEIITDKSWILMVNPSASISPCLGVYGSIKEISAAAEKSADERKQNKIIIFEAVGGFVDGKVITISGKKTEPTITPEKTILSTKLRNGGVGRMRRIFQERTWVIFSPENAANKKNYKTHHDFGDAVEEAHRLSLEYPKQKMLIMESLLGIIVTAETGKEFVHIIDKKVGIACQELFKKINTKKPAGRGRKKINFNRQQQPSVYNKP